MLDVMFIYNKGQLTNEVGGTLWKGTCEKKKEEKDSTIYKNKS